MRNVLLLIILVFLVYKARGQEEIICQEGSCHIPSSIDATYVVETPSFSQFRITGLEGDLDIYAEEGTTPRNSKMTIFESEGETINLRINLPSTRPGAVGGSTVVIGDNLSSISVNVSGSNGANADDASVICARKIMNGELGATVRSNFIISRNSNPSLPTDRCTPEDVTAIQNSSFECDSSYTEFDGVNVSATRWNKRRECKADSSRMMCVERKVKITCTWIADKFPGKNSCNPNNPNGTATLSPRPKGGGFGGRNWECDPSLASDTSSGWKLRFDPIIVSENWLKARRQSGMSDEAICDELTGRDTTYLNSISDLRRNYYYSRPAGKNIERGISNISNGKLMVRRGYWYGYSSPSWQRLPTGYRGFNLSSVGYIFNVKTLGCDSNVARNEGDFLRGYDGDNSNCPNPNTFRFHRYENGYYVFKAEYYQISPSSLVLPSVHDTMSHIPNYLVRTTRGDPRTFWFFGRWSTVAEVFVPMSWASGNTNDIPQAYTTGVTGFRLPRDYSRHTNADPLSIQCWQNGESSIDCSNTGLGEAYRYSFRVKMDLYAPNGRMIEYTIHATYGKF